MSFSIPWDALFGGVLLGFSAVLLLLFNGKIAGISGIIAGAIKPKNKDNRWKILFLVGMAVSVVLIAPFGYQLPDVSDKNLITVAIAALFVGIGTRLGNGCTSGHGIIGMGRFSKRSIVATLVFMGFAITTVFIQRMLGVL